MITYPELRSLSFLAEFKDTETFIYFRVNTHHNLGVVWNFAGNGSAQWVKNFNYNLWNKFFTWEELTLDKFENILEDLPAAYIEEILFNMDIITKIKLKDENYRVR